MQALSTGWFSHLGISSLQPINQIAQQEQALIKNLTLEAIINWNSQRTAQ